MLRSAHATKTSSILSKETKNKTLAPKPISRHVPIRVSPSHPRPSLPVSSPSVSPPKSSPIIYSLRLSPDLVPPRVLPSERFLHLLPLPLLLSLPSLLPSSFSSESPSKKRLPSAFGLLSVALCAGSDMGRRCTWRPRRRESCALGSGVDVEGPSVAVTERVSGRD
jgi:hypothetical protein